MGLMDAVRRAIGGKDEIEQIEENGDRLAQDFGSDCGTINVIDARKPEIEDLDNYATQTRFTAAQNSTKRNENEALVDVFAIVRKATYRVFGLRYCHVYLLGGIALHRGIFAEIVTVEGTTNAGVLFAALNAAEGVPVTIITMNIYLARHVEQLVFQVVRFFELSAGLMQSYMPTNA